MWSERENQAAAMIQARVRGTQTRADLLLAEMEIRAMRSELELRLKHELNRSQPQNSGPGMRDRGNGEVLGAAEAFSAHVPTAVLCGWRERGARCVIADDGYD